MVVHAELTMLTVLGLIIRIRMPLSAPHAGTIFVQSSHL